MSADHRCSGPLFEPLRHWLAALPTAPDSAELNGLLRRYPVLGEDGRPICFQPPTADGLSYESRISRHGVVETRPDNWHDFFNVLIWLCFPLSKRAITAQHVAAMTPAGAGRGSVRDALTHFDECGIVVLSTQPELLDLLRSHRWRELFAERRQAVKQCMRFVIFGHATYERLLNPYRGLTAKAILYVIDDGWIELLGAALNAAIDRRLAADLARGNFASPRDFQPLPLLGIPGVTPDSEVPAYYDDVRQFRPARRAALQ